MSSLFSQLLQVSVGDAASLTQRTECMHGCPCQHQCCSSPGTLVSGRGRGRSSPHLPRNHILDRSRIEPIISYNMTISISCCVSWMSCISPETWIRSVAFAGTGVSASVRIHHLFPTNHYICQKQLHNSMLSFLLKWKTDCPRTIITTCGPLLS